MNRTTILKAILATVVFPGTVTVVVPYYLLDSANNGKWPGFSAGAMVALVVGAMGFGMLFHCIWGFAFHGKGTLAPIDPPKILVVRGLYRHSRNPMYAAVILIVLAEALFFSSVLVLVYAMAVFIVFHLFVTLYEEPHLRSQFGEAYKEYLRRVPRWGIAIRGFPRETQNNSARD